MENAPASSGMPNQNVAPIRLSAIIIEIHNELLLWVVPLCVLTLGFVIYLTIEKAPEAATKAPEQVQWLVFTAGSFNESLFSLGGVGTLLVVMTLGGFFLAFVGGRRFKENSYLEKLQLQTFLVVSVLLVLTCIFLTGGFLDSPFTVALSIYIGGFLILQDRTDTKTFNVLLVLLTTILILGAYLWLYLSGREMYFFAWRHEERGITLIRFLIVFLITGFSIWQADRTNKAIERLYAAERTT